MNNAESKEAFRVSDLLAATALTLVALVAMAVKAIQIVVYGSLFLVGLFIGVYVICAIVGRTLGI